VGRDFEVLDWRDVNTPLGLPGLRQALCTCVFFVPLPDDLPAKIPQVHFYATSLPLIKDRTFHEDRHWLKDPNAAGVMTFLRSLAVGLLRKFRIPGRTGRSYCPEKIEYMQNDPARPVKMVCEIK
jgi:hypothetical protein